MIDEFTQSETAKVTLEAEMDALRMESDKFRDDIESSYKKIYDII